jgi:uncharacterized protein
MAWRELLFAHWRVSPESLRALIPEPLEIDRFNDTCYVGVVPFIMEGVRGRWLPPFPTTGRFLELNLRSYVTLDGKPGVWFFSLDAESALAVRAARLSFGLPYFDASMQLERRDGWTHYRSERTHRGAPAALFEGRYRGVGESFEAKPGSLEHWLTERYCLYVGAGPRGVRRGDIHHHPWALRRGEAEISSCSLIEAAGLEPEGAPLLHASAGVDTVSWLPQRCR